MTLSIAKLSITILCRYDVSYYVECLVSFMFMLSVFNLNAVKLIDIMLCVIMLSVVMLIVSMLSVVAPIESDKLIYCLIEYCIFTKI
jgi:hypothetical protein